MLIIDSEEKQQKLISAGANKNIFLKVKNVKPRVFLGIGVYIAPVYLRGSGTVDSPWLGSLSVKF